MNTRTRVVALVLAAVVTLTTTACQRSGRTSYKHGAPSNIQTVRVLA